MFRFLALTLVGLCAAFPARASEPRIYLSSHAAYGHAGADSLLSWAAGDSAQVDTLYLTFDPGRACSTFVGVSGKLVFHAAGGDSLNSLWAPSAPQTPPSWIRVEYGFGAEWDPPFPWRSFGVGLAGYGRPAPNEGVMLLVYAVSAQGGATIAGGRPYTFARVILTRPAAGTPGRDHPVCIEWLEASMAFSLEDKLEVSDGVRYVGLNDPRGISCVAPRVRSAHPSMSGPWKPPQGK